MKTKRLTGRVLVTGGAGFIARALYQRALDEQWDCLFFPYSREDGKLRAVEERFANVSEVRRGDVADFPLVHATIHEIQPDIVIHAAAAKYVDISEKNAWDTRRVNVDGSANVASAAWAASVPLAIAISTDKACKPVNTYGATKFLMERLWQEIARWSPEDSRFVVARYGNVIGSTGSALPRMRAQAKDLQPVTITNPDMTRFWMTAQEAIDTILEAAEAPAGTVTIPIDIRAATLMTAVHAAVGNMAQIETISRPGEKADETLMTAAEHRRSQTHGDAYFFIDPPDSEISPIDGRDLTSDAPWGGNISAGEISVVLDEAATI